MTSPRGVGGAVLGLAVLAAAGIAIRAGAAAVRLRVPGEPSIRRARRAHLSPREEVHRE